jgi:hypothetical protein
MDSITTIQKLERVLETLKAKRPNVAGLGAPIFILKDVIEELKAGKIDGIKFTKKNDSKK